MKSRLPGRGKVHGYLKVIWQHQLFVLFDSLLVLALYFFKILQLYMIKLANCVLNGEAQYLKKCGEVSLDVYQTLLCLLKLDAFLWGPYLEKKGVA